MVQAEDYIIEEPYRPTKEEAISINELLSEGIKYTDWDSRRIGIKSFKDNIREYLYDKQNYRCAYCRIEIPDVCFQPLDHIVPKKDHPKWMFEPKNLCVSCERCNSYKTNKEVLMSPEDDGYPSQSKDFKIVNPYLDKYFDHINLENGLVYRGITSKGRFTIETCGLSRVQYVIARAKKKMIKEQPDSIIMQVLQLLDTDDIDYKTKVIESLERIVKAYKRNI